MQRKIIKQGNNSYTLTLPIDWVRENELDKTLNVNVNREENSIVISADSTRKEREITVDMKNKSERLVRVVLNNLYRSGYTKIVIENYKEEKFIDEFVSSRLLGFEVVKIEKDRLTIKNIAEPSPDNFNSILRKVFLIIKQSLEFQIDKETANHKVNLYVNYLQRIIVSTKSFGAESNHNMYSITTRLLLIQHSLARMKEKTILFDETKQLFDDLTTAFFSKNSEKVFEAHDKLSVLNHDSYIKNLKNNNNSDYFYLGDIIRHLYLISTNAIVVLNFRD